MTEQHEQCPMGKCTEEIKTLVPQEVKDEIKALATLYGMGVSEYVRDVLLNHVYGHLAVVRAKHHVKR